MTAEKKPTPEERQPTNLAREWIEGLHRELRRHDKILEQFRSECVACKTLLAELKTSALHHDKIISDLRLEVRDGTKESTRSDDAVQVKLEATAKEIRKELADAVVSWQETKIKVTLIWAGIAGLASALAVFGLTKLFG